MLIKRFPLRRLALPFIAALLAGPATAAELGEVSVKSHIGQQLSADIELVDLTPADLAEVQARLANPDVFKGANLSVNPALAGLHISVAKRDQRRFLHLTTLQPVTTEALHIFLELNSGGRQVIRAATLWLTPEPPSQRIARTPLPAAAPVIASAAPSIAPAPAASPATAPPPRKLSDEAELAAVAERAFAERKRREAERTSAAAAVPPQAPLAAPAKPEPQVQAPVAAVPRRAPAMPAKAPAACVPAQVEAQIQQCQAMTGKLVALEGRVQTLQAAMTAPPAAAKSAQPEAPKPAAAQPPVAPPKVKPAAVQVSPEAVAALANGKKMSRPKMIMLIGGSVIGGLALIGGMVYFLRKRKVRGPVQIWQSFRKKAEPEPKEPTLEQVAEVAEQS